MKLGPEPEEEDLMKDSGWDKEGYELEPRPEPEKKSEPADREDQKPEDGQYGRDMHGSKEA